jgi:hypothetical protein
MTADSRKALDRGLQWLQRTQGPDGNWTTNNLGLVSMGLLAFLADGHAPGRGRYGTAEKRALDYVLRNAKPSGLLNIAGQHHDMYNHGLSTFVLGQAYGMTSDPRVGPVLDRALTVIFQSQCRDGGWRYEAWPEPRVKANGNDLSLAVVQAKALRSAVDSGFEIPPTVIEAAIRDVREHYTMKRLPQDPPDLRDLPEEEQKKHEGRFTYSKGGWNDFRDPLDAMPAAGVVCLQEFAQYDDWRIAKNIELIEEDVRKMTERNPRDPPFDSYKMYYIAQALYQVGGEPWKRCYPRIRDRLVSSQIREYGDAETNGGWRPTGRVDGKPGMLYQTAVACFVLAIPNRYLPILQEGRIDSLRKQFDKK